MKQTINVFDRADDITKALQNGILLTTRAEAGINTMTIGWGTLGIVWGKPVFIAMVRTNRYTRQQLDQVAEFTVNIPYGEFDKKILGFCGTKTGKTTDKIEALGLTLTDPVSISVPGIKELPLTLECRVIYQQPLDPGALSEEIKKKYYPQDVDSTFPGANKDYHITYYGEIVNAYIIQ